jgi:hypothetical protein
MNFKSLSVLMVMLLSPSISIADNSCIDDHPTGHVIPIDRKLPEEWLTIGVKSLIDPTLFTELRSKFKKQYVSHQDGTGSLCTYSKGVYIHIVTSEFGPSAEYSNTISKCSKCTTGDVNPIDLNYKAGISIGQNRSEVSSKLGGIPLNEEIEKISFEEHDKKDHGGTYHDQSITLDFKEDKLVRIFIYDYREGE